MVRKALSLGDKNRILALHCPCVWCGKKLGLGEIHYDHVEFHALGGSDVDPMNYSPMHRPCHEAKTRGEKHRPLSGDISVIAKVKRVTKNHEAFRARLLAKEEGSAPPPRKGKRPWPKRSMRSSTTT